jgi:tetratricopeptide (TPR) repeat protein
MSIERGTQDRPAEAAGGDATGAFFPESAQARAADEAPPAQPSVTDGTGVYLPERQPPTGRPVDAPLPDATEVFVPAAPEGPAAAEATGAFLPGAAEAPAGPPAQGATGVYVPGAIHAPGNGRPANPEQTGSPAAPSATGAPQPGDGGGGTGVYVPGGEAGQGVTGTFGPSGAPAGGHDGAGVRQGQPGGAAEAPADGERRVGRYVLKCFHAKGGMGEIWLAEDTDVGRSVALKRMLGRQPASQARFLIEAQITGQLEHPGIVPVHELGQTPDGQPFYVMKFVRGQTLKKVIREYHAALKESGQPQEVEELRLLQIFSSLCQTVAYAHSRGVLHRDLKPENVMLGPYGETLVLDWGIAKVLGQPDLDLFAESPDTEYVQLTGTITETGTQAGAIMGSPSYMAPEVAGGRNDEVDQRSDVYLLGATLYEILTGALPRKADTLLLLLKKAQHEPPAPPRQVNPHVPRALEAICLKAMAFRKEDRYASALEVAGDVQRYLAGEPVSAYREGTLARAWRWAKKHRVALTRSAVAALVVGLVAVSAVLLRAAERRRAEAAHRAEVLLRQKQAQEDVKEFRRLADEMHFYAATTDPVSERAPYFAPEKGEATGRAALAVAEKWGPDLSDLPLEEERNDLRKEVYDLLLLMAQVKSPQAKAPPAAREMLALLDRAAPLREPSQSYYRLEAQADRVLGDEGKADDGRRRAEDPKTPATALDHFLQGERHRQEVVKDSSAQTEEQTWQRNRDRLKKALSEYRLAVAHDPQQYWARFQIGRCALQLKQGEEAVEALTYCVALRPDSPWGYTERGFILGELNRYAEAEADLGRALQLAPDLRLARLDRGAVYWLEKKNDAALADFDAVLQPPDDKRLVEAAYYRGQIYLQHADKDKGLVDKALADFDLVVKERPDFRRVYVPRAQIYLAKGQDAKALEEVNTYLSLGGPFDPKSAEGHAQRARLLRLVEMAPGLRKGKVALALADVDEALRLGARSADQFDDRGALLEQVGRMEEAARAYSQGLEQRPKDVLLLNKRGWAWEALGQHAKAQDDFAAALRLMPDNAEAHTGLGYVRAIRTRDTDALREASLALLTGTDKYMILHNVACIYATLAQSDRSQAAAHEAAAVALLRRAVELWKRSGDSPSEIDLIKGESSFGPALRARPDFQELLRDAGP